MRAWLLPPDRIPDAAFHRSEFHADGARPMDLHHPVGAVLHLGGRPIMPPGLRRPPRTAPSPGRIGAGCSACFRIAAARDALVCGAVVVAGDLRIGFATAAAAALATPPDAFAPMRDPAGGVTAEAAAIAARSWTRPGRGRSATWNG